MEELMSDVVAAIDCGTNSIRLLVARADGGRLVDLDRRMTVVRLGEGVDRTGMLAPAALERTFAACREYREVITEFGAGVLRFVATSASRDAGNAVEFTAGVAQILGVVPEVITGQEEARLSFTGATRGLPHEKPVLVFDIGGGSTEFVLGDDGVRQSISVDMGCVRFFERYLGDDPPTRQQIADLQGEVAQLLDRVKATVDVASARDVIGLAGTVTTVAALALGLATYDSEQIHGSRITTRDVRRVADELAGMPVARRRELGVMHPGRADVIVSGSLILAQILERFGAQSLVASEHDILDGLAWSLLDRVDQPRNANQ